MQEFPKYFESMLKNNSLIVNDVESNPNTHELYDYYFKPNGIKSLIDHVIKINGKMIENEADGSLSLFTVS